MNGVNYTVVANLRILTHAVKMNAVILQLCCISVRREGKCRVSPQSAASSDTQNRWSLSKKTTTTIKQMLKAPHVLNECFDVKLRC